MVACVVDSDENKEATVDALTQFVEDGLIIERLLLDDIRSNLGRRCEKCKAKLILERAEKEGKG